jgi:glycosyltransferase involved in cell wall biosynthesis
VHSSLPQQVANFGYPRASLLARFLRSVERLMIRRSRVVIVICQELADTVREIDPSVPTVLIENAPGSGDRPVAGSGASIRRALGIDASTPIVLYTGTFEAYQGLDLLYRAMLHVQRSRPDARLVMVGGDDAQVAAARAATRALGLGESVIFTGQQPAEEIPSYLDAATMLVSPRSTGTNTPLKIYQYLRSGRPIIATRLRTHTQVLSDDTAILADPTPESFGRAIVDTLADPARAIDTGRRAQELAASKYSDEAFLARTERAYRVLAGERQAEVAGGLA